jgi:hypothetical protein
MPLLSMSACVGAVWDGVDDEDVADGEVGVTDVMAVDWRFDNVPCVLEIATKLVKFILCDVEPLIIDWDY